MLLAALAVAGCGGGGGGVPPPVSPPITPPAAQSVGGIWFGRDSALQQVSIFVAEDGEARITLRPGGAVVPSFGAGTLSLAAGNLVGGAFDVSGILAPGSLPTEDLGCSLTGTLAARQSMTVEVGCSDSAGIVYDEALTLMFESRYERPSSLAAIAGNYTLPVRSSTNTLNINADGTIFGLYDNGPRCTVNGRVSVIDPDYSLLAVTWTFSACTDPLGLYEGVEMSGFAQEDLAPSGPAGRYYFLLTGRTRLGIFAVSVLYDPV